MATLTFNKCFRENVNQWNSEKFPIDYLGAVNRNVDETLMGDLKLKERYIRGEIEDIHPEAIEKTAKERGMLTHEQAGVLAALRGETTLEEVNRAI